jgi:hypothetical protein
MKLQINADATKPSNRWEQTLDRRIPVFEPFLFGEGTGVSSLGFHGRSCLGKSTQTASGA